MIDGETFWKRYFHILGCVSQLEKKASETPIGNNPLHRSRILVKARMVESRADRAQYAWEEKKRDEAQAHLDKAYTLLEGLRP